MNLESWFYQCSSSPQNPLFSQSDLPGSGLRLAHLKPLASILRVQLEYINKDTFSTQTAEITQKLIQSAAGVVNILASLRRRL